MDNDRITLTRQRLWLPLILAAIALVALPGLTNARALTIGSLSDTPDAEIALFLPLATYLSMGLKEFDIDKGKVRITRTHEQMANLMKQGKVDLFIDSSVSALKMNRLGAGDFFLRRWKKGIAEYHSVIFTTANSPLKQISDLAGHTIGFEEPFSSSGYLLPASEIRNHHLILTKDQVVTDDKSIDSRFTGADENTLMWVLHGRLDAGAMAGNKLKKLAGPLISELKIIHTSSTIPYHVMLTRPDLENHLQAAIKDLLTTMHSTVVGKRVLNDFERTSRFDEIPVQAITELSTINFGSDQ
ncbi:MAG: phosphate/phosphite/phosphonate ABC transporter substrate-binding protein [Immundisolibacteraceae bacterium]|nr:phosphate/phosphite/phosphonate ABC transporter substrate-binding protein [Immundisolibacteraceae bacterium]